jgi:hypothetical protein
VPATELRLSAVPYRIVYESLRETSGRLNWEIFVVNADGSGMTNLTNTPDIDEHYRIAGWQTARRHGYVSVGSPRSRPPHCRPICMPTSAIRWPTGTRR